MLVRSAGRRQQRHQTSQILAASFAQLNLPWLAPAQLRWSASYTLPPGSAAPRSRKRSWSRPKSPAPPKRPLATAAAAELYASRYDSLSTYNGTFESPSDKHTPKNVPWEPKLSYLRPYREPIVINNSVQSPAQTFKLQHGLSATAAELLQYLNASLQVGRFARAAAIVRRLAEQFPAGSREIAHAHTAYLEQMLTQLASHGRGPEAQRILASMARWFELEIRAKSVAVDAKMLVIMIRGAIRALDGSKRSRTIRRYADIGEHLGDDVFEEVLYSEDYDDNEFTILSALMSPSFEGEDPMKQQQQMGESTHDAIVKQEQFRRRDALNVDELPEARATSIKGESLTGIKQAMDELTKFPSLPADEPWEEQRAVAYERQRRIEETVVEVAIERWRKADDELRKIGIHTAMQSKPMSALMWQWYEALLPALEDELAECKKAMCNPESTDYDRNIYGPYLEMLSLEKVAANTILYTITRIANGKSRETKKFELNVKLVTLITGLARTVWHECVMESSKIKSVKKRARKTKTFSPRHIQRALAKQNRDKERAKDNSESREGETAIFENSTDRAEWPIAARVKLGAVLISKLLETAQLPVTRNHPRTKQKTTQMQPAFLHRIKYENGKRYGMVTPNPVLVEKIQSEPVGSLIAKRMPMIVEPKPWTSWNEGGFLHYSSPAVRLKADDESGKDYFLAAQSKGEVDQLLAGLTALGKVPWRIHHGVFKVQLEAWNSGEEVANFAPLHPQINNPPEPAPSSGAEARRKWLAELRAAEHKRAGLHSMRCFQNFQIEVARAMVNETLYFPHNMDFRGRAYPIPPYLNHMGADNVRGLLVFADGKELGPNGLRWLKIHLATMAGYDKASMDERVDFTMKHLDDIYDSVRNPLNGRRWWLEAEDSWQLLSACFELTGALDSPDPTKFVSHLPVQQDGTCNGLQHYAALGGDKIGAAQVNLEPGDRPADVYTAVAEAVKQEVHKDALAGDPLAKKLDGHLTRKIVKHPVMTNVYGVTWYGAKAQVEKQIELIFRDTPYHGELGQSHMSRYVATKIFKSLGEMFKGAQAIQEWLGQCADRISTCLTPEQIADITAPKPPVIEEKKEGKKKKVKPSKYERDDLPKRQVSQGSIEADRQQHREAKPLFKSTVVWTTPLRLPVVQPYRTSVSRVISTNLQMVGLQEPKVWHPVMKRKQLQAFPPNFIHSLDATHMMLSALKCSEVGITFASIHDSFWCHAADVDNMSVLLRDAFIAMHKDDIVGRLREEFQTRYKGAMYLASVVAKTSVGEKIGRWRKAQSKGKSEQAGSYSELALEAERVRLLQSEDAEERARGEAMETPASILASEGDGSTFHIPREISGQRLGSIPNDAEMKATEPEMEESNSDPDASGFFGDGAAPDTVTKEATTSEEVQQLPEEGESTEKKRSKTGKRLKATGSDKRFVWLPIEFPPVPPKGGFDVGRLSQSRYFFH